MSLLPLTAIDITPGYRGLVNLWSQGDGFYEVRDHLCGLEAFRLLAVTNYTDMLMWISPGTCIRLFNPGSIPIQIGYTWTMDHSDSLMIVNTIMWIILMCILGGAILLSCSFGGIIVRLIGTILQRHRKDMHDTPHPPPSAPQEIQLSQMINDPPQAPR